ncbi:MAG TPA: (d)CMP kinase [Microscillaceae bacterium]|nr:(d)CMP kinase [Microscillaceae bacterium]
MNDSQKIIIAIDGFSGCGKSTTAKEVAKALNYIYIDTGAMYRAVTLYFYRHKVDTRNTTAIQMALQNIEIRFEYEAATQKNITILNEEVVEDEIRQMYISERVSAVSALPEVREAMVAQQRQMGINKGIVMDGRDIGTNVFPNAELKIFMQAQVQVRAVRRQKELQAKGQEVDLQEIADNLSQRDHLDSTRTENPLRQAEDAHVIDTTQLTIEQQSQKIIQLAVTLQNV